MRLLFTSTSGMGHFNALVLLIDAAVARDDDVLVVGPPKLEPVLAARDQAYRIGAAPAEAETAQLTVEPTGEPMGRTGVLAPGDSGRIRQSLELILADDSYRQAAQGLAAEMSALPTATARELLGGLQVNLEESPRVRSEQRS
jgi:hypothetical protein